MRTLIEDLQGVGLVPRWGSASVSMRLPDPGESGYEFTVVVLLTSGAFFVAWQEYLHDKGGYDESIAERYIASLSNLTGIPPKGLGISTSPLEPLLSKSDEFLQLVREHVERLQRAAEETTT